MQADPPSIPELVARNAALLSGHVAIEDGGVKITYAELWQAVQRTAAGLVASGVQEQDRVAIWAPNTADWVVLALAVSSAGATLVPINTRFKAEEAGYVLCVSRARLLFTVREFLGTRYFEQLRDRHGGAAAAQPIAGLPSLEQVVLLDAEVPGTLSLEELRGRAAKLPERTLEARIGAVSETFVSDILFTSGTTGRPKGVCTTHRQNLRAYRAWCDAVGLTRDDRYLVVSPFFHAFGYKAGILACQLAGATLLPHAVFDAGRVLERLQRESISVLPGPPTLYQSLLAQPELSRAQLPRLRLAVTGAAVVPIELVRRMKSELGFETIVTGYGLTESCGIATMCRAGDDLETIAGTSGRPIEGVEVRVMTTDGRPAACGEPGEVQIRGYNVMSGYFEAQDASREAIDADGFLHTGDIGTLDARGNLRITDRLKDMYIAGGFNCYPAEIERVIAEHPGVAQASVIGIPDERLGEVGMAFIVPRPGHFVDLAGEAAALERELGEFCRARMANYKVPRRFAVLPALPLNAAGKVLKHELRAHVV